MRKRTLGYFLTFATVFALLYYANNYLGMNEQFGNPSVREASLMSVMDEETPEEIPEPTLLFGIPIDSFGVIEGKVRWNESLAEILGGYNINYETIYKLSHAAKGIFDVRKLKAGFPYTIIHERDEEMTARQFIFQPDPRRYVVFNMADSAYVYLHTKPVVTEEKVVTGTIVTSFYDAAVDNHASMELVDKVVDIFAWQVDFFRMQKGDQFKIIYEEERVDDQVVGIKSIKGAYFKHFDKDYYAVRYVHDGFDDYFDENGNSMRRSLLRSPLNYSRISSRFNPRRFHPVLKRYKAHLGTDYAAPTGTPIRSVGDGVVEKATYHKYNGNYVKIKHNSNYTTQYLHMSKIAQGVRSGVKVKQGQIIGYVGSTGLANGPHLCYRFWKNGRQVDALKVELPPAEPIKAVDRVDFFHTKNIIIHRLDKTEIEDTKPLFAQLPVE